MNVDTIHLKHCILYEFRKGRNVLEIIQSLSSIYNNVTENFCKYWFARFRSNNFNLTDENEPDVFTIQDMSDEELEHNKTELNNKQKFNTSFDAADYDSQIKQFGNDLTSQIKNKIPNIKKLDDKFKEVFSLI